MQLHQAEKVHGRVEGGICYIDVDQHSERGGPNTCVETLQKDETFP